MTTFKDYLINECDDCELVELYKYYVDEEVYYAMGVEELVDDLGFTASDAIRRMYYGDVESLNDYAFINTLGNIETTDSLTTLIDVDELVEVLINEEHTIYENWLTSNEFYTNFEAWLTTEKADKWDELKVDYTINELIDGEHDLFNEFVEFNLI